MPELTQNMSPELLQALKQREELVTFYSLGFLDAWILCNDIKISGNSRGKGNHNREQRLFERIQDKVQKKFEDRFFKGIEKQLKKVKEKV